ncbi:MAG TPA: DNA polymerase III subunit delta' [Desulfobulbus sp.]|nr:DNA polymerase III subunit delta' [Desulfobulbus sp.]
MTTFDFSGILGQAKAINLLTRALSSGRLAHAYLFSGPDGVGKTRTAMILAAALLCTDANSRPCGRCPGCLKFASANHPDFLAIRPDGVSIRIDQVRELKKTLAFAPFEAGLRVVVLEEVQTMRREAGNSLLKVLEEPPPDNLLILVASDSEPILPTILSRCQVIPFYPLPLELAAEIIAREHSGLDREGVLALATLTNGCPGRAGRLEAGGALELYRQVVAELAAPPPGEAAQVETALALAARMVECKQELDVLLDLLRIFYKDVMIAALLGTAHSAEVARARERWNLERLSDKIAAIDSAHRALARNCNRALVCETLLLDLFSEAG